MVDSKRSSTGSIRRSREFPRATSLPSRKVSKPQRVSYAITKAFVQTGAIDESTRYSEVEQGLFIDGDISIVTQIEGTQEILCLCYTETFDYLGLGLTDGTIRLINTRTGEFSSTLRDAEIIQNSGPITAIKHRPVQPTLPVTETLTAAYATGCVKCWHYPTGRCLYTIRENRHTLGLAYHPNLPKFVTFGEDMKLCVYDEETKTLERILQASIVPHAMDGHRARIFAACFRPRSSHELISGGWDDTIQFWDIREPHSLRYISGVHICGDSLDISNDGNEIITCAWSNKDTIQQWDYGSGKLIVTLKPDSWNSLLYAGKYIGTNFVACGGCDANLFRIIDLRAQTTLSSIRNLSGGVYSIDYGPPSSKQQKRSLRIAPLPRIAFSSGKSVYVVEASV